MIVILKNVSLDVVFIIGTVFFSISVFLFTYLFYLKFKKKLLLALSLVTISGIFYLLTSVTKFYTPSLDGLIWIERANIIFLLSFVITLPVLLYVIRLSYPKLLLRINIWVFVILSFFTVLQPFLFNNNHNGLFRNISVIYLSTFLIVHIGLITYNITKRTTTKQLTIPILSSFVILCVGVFIDYIIVLKSFSVLWIGIGFISLLVMLMSINMLLLLYQTTKGLSSDLIWEVEQNIEEIKRSKEDIQKEKEYWKNLITTSGDAIMVLDKDLKITTWNKSLESLYGIPSSEAEKRNLFEVFSYDPELVENWKRSINKIKKGKTLKSYETRIRQKDGEVKHLEFTATPIFDDDSNIVNISTIIRDVTFKEKMRQELLQKKKELELLNTTKDDFILSMSHELRTPLNSILGLSQILINDDSITMNDLPIFVRRIYNNGQHLLNMINNMIDLSKIKSGIIELIITPIDVEELCDYAYSIANIHLMESPVRFKIYAEENLKKFYSDKMRVKQIITNLLTNALKFTKKGFVNLHCKRLDKNKIEIVIKDTGIGIPEQEQQNIFERFSQVDGSGSKEQGGIGIGLTLTRELVYLLGESIELKSKEGEGSEFRVVLTDYRKSDTLEVKTGISI